jgi:L-lactate dehydrogenase
MTAPAKARYRAQDLVEFGTALLGATGMDAEKARDTSEILVEGELMGKWTHGYALLPRYVREVESGAMAKSGDPIVLHDAGASLAWDGRKLPGPWLVLRAMDEAMARAGKYGMGGVTLARSHHLACLGAFLKRATDKGFMMFLTLTDPAHSGVAPYGGVTPVQTSNPIAFGAPTSGDPVLIDMTTSLQSNIMMMLARQSGRKLEHADLLDNQGRPSTDPMVIVSDPPGSILPLGGMKDGHKGASLGLMVELLTGCLAGWGRADPPEGWSAAAFLLIIDPAFFGGREAYLRQADHLTALWHASKPRPDFDRVRLPGEGSLERRTQQSLGGVFLPTALMDELAEQAARLKVQIPTPF